MRSSNCKNCGKAIVWMKKAGSERYNPPLDAESAQSGYCVVDEEVHFTYMYRKHDCTIADIEAYEKVLELKRRRELERAEEERLERQAKHHDYVPAPVFQRPSQQQKQEQPVPVAEPVPAVHDWREKPTDPDDLMAWNYNPAIQVECPLCHATPGEYCINRQPYYVNRGLREATKNPHRIRTEVAETELRDLASIVHNPTMGGE